MPAAAQTTRQEALQQKREEKARQLRPYEPGPIEAGLIQIEEGRYLERLFSIPNGLYPRIGRVTAGAGFALGPAYRVNGLLKNQLDVTVGAAISTKRYWLAEAIVSLPRLANNRLFIEVQGRRRDFPQEDFFGLGQRSRRTSRTSYSLRETSVGATAGVRATRWLSAGGRLEHLWPDVGPGTDSRFPSIERVFTEPDAPGLAAQPAFWRAEGFIDLDSRDPVASPRSGGRYVVAYSAYHDRDLDRYSFRRLDVELQQYLSVLHGHRVLALRALLSLSDAEAGQQVPFYLQRTLGGSHTLRGFRSYRFRDRHLVLLQAEYRWEILPILGAALFYDAGKVVADRRDLSLARLDDDYGFGLRFGSDRGVFFRVDIAYARGEATRVLLRFNHAF